MCIIKVKRVTPEGVANVNGKKIVNVKNIINKNLEVGLKTPVYYGKEGYGTTHDMPGHEQYLGEVVECCDEYITIRVYSERKHINTSSNLASLRAYVKSMGSSISGCENTYRAERVLFVSIW